MRITTAAVLTVALFQTTLFAKDLADVIFVDGNIVTASVLRPEVEALAISNGRILAVGDLEDVLVHKGSKTEVIELRGRTVMPGFVGAHTHPIYHTLTSQLMSVRPGKFKDFDSMIAALTEAARKGDIFAFGYDASLTEGAKELGFATLDPVSSEHIVVVLGLSAHEAYGNRLAFEAAGITEQTPNPSGGSLVRDESGRLTGAALEIPGVGLVLRANKQAPDFPALAKEALRLYASHGFTTITATGLGFPLPTPQAHIDLLRAAALADDAPVRLQGYVVSEMLDQIPEFMRDNNDRFRVLGVKIWVDGSVQGHTAALEENYLDSGTKGTANYTQEELNETIAKAHRMRLQIATHANGDRGVRMAFEALEAAQAAHPRKDARHRIEHFTVTDRDMLKRAKNAGITPTFLNQHVFEWGQVFVHHLGPERADTIDPAGSAERLDMHFSFHDDAPTGLPDPLLMMQIAVTREMRKGGILNADERIPIDRAIRAVTLDPAWQSFIEDTRGSLDVGKYADLVILSGNPRKADPGAIKDIEVLETWVAGKKVFSND